MSIADDIAREIERLIKVSCKHQFIDAKDGTGDKVFTICGKRAKQAVVYFK